MRCQEVEDRVNLREVSCLNVQRRPLKFLPTMAQDLRVGDIIRIQEEEEFPADCLILHVPEAANGRSFVTPTAFCSD